MTARKNVYLLTPSSGFDLTNEIDCRIAAGERITVVIKDAAGFNRPYLDQLSRSADVVFVEPAFPTKILERAEPCQSPAKSEARNHSPFDQLVDDLRVPMLLAELCMVVSQSGNRGRSRENMCRMIGEFYFD